MLIPLEVLRRLAPAPASASSAQQETGETHKKGARADGGPHGFNREKALDFFKLSLLPDPFRDHRPAGTAVEGRATILTFYRDVGFIIRVKYDLGM